MTAVWLARREFSLQQCPRVFTVKKTERKERKGCRLDSKPITRSSILPPLGFAAPAIVSISCCAVTRFRQRPSIETTSRHSQVYSAVLSLLCWCSQTQLIYLRMYIYIILILLHCRLHSQAPSSITFATGAGHIHL